MTNLKSASLKLLGVLALMSPLAISANASAALVEGKDYTVLNQPLTNAPTVYMAMSFHCTHCEEFTNKYKVPEKLNNLMQTEYKAENGQFVEFQYTQDNNNLFRDLGMFRAVLYVTKRDDLIPDGFDLFYKYAGDNRVFKEFLAEKLEKSLEDVEAIWNSFSVKNFYRKEVNWTKNFDIVSTPTFIINGRYVLKLESLSHISVDGPEALGDLVVSRINEMLKELK